MKNRYIVFVAIIGLLIAVMPAYAQGDQTIAIGETVTGTLEGNEADYTISLERDDAIVVALESDDFDTYLEFSQDGTELSSNDDGGSGTNSRLNFFASEAGDYTITVRGFGGSATGAYTLSVSAIEVSTISVGETIEGETSATTYYQIELGATQCVVVQWVAPTSDFDPVLEVLNSQGFQVGRDDDGGSGLNSWLPFCSTEAGLYVLVATGYSGEPSGEFLLTVSETAAPVTFTNEVGDIFEGRAEGETTDDSISVNYLVELDADQTIAIILTSEGSGSYFEVTTDDFETTLEYGNSSSEFGSALAFTASEAGSYGIVVETFFGTEAYSLNIFNVEAPIASENDFDFDFDFGDLEPIERGTIAVGDTVEGNAEGANEIYTLTLETETTVTISLSSAEFDPYLTVEDTDEFEIGSDDDSGGNFNSLLEITLAPGDYRVVVSSFFGTPSGSYTLSIN